MSAARHIAETIGFLLLAIGALHLATRAMDGAQACAFENLPQCPKGNGNG